MKAIRFVILLLIIIGIVGIVQGCKNSAKAPRIQVKSLKSIKNSIDIEMVLIPSGRFVMGEATRAKCNTCNAAKDETPRHWVTIDRSYYISKYEITQKQWLAIMNLNPSHYKGDQQPVENVSWNNVQLFIYALNHKEKTQKYRLPTEAEWEYAARAGTQTAFAFGDSYQWLNEYGWYVNNAGDHTHPVGQLPPNAWGLFDVHGNVYEWCQDVYDAAYYAKSPASDPKGAKRGSQRVRRGGAYNCSARRCRSSDRDAFEPDVPLKNTGFRIVMDF